MIFVRKTKYHDNPRDLYKAFRYVFAKMQKDSSPINDREKMNGISALRNSEKKAWREGTRKRKGRMGRTDGGGTERMVRGRDGKGARKSRGIFRKKGLGKGEEREGMGEGGEARMVG